MTRSNWRFWTSLCLAICVVPISGQGDQPAVETEVTHRSVPARPNSVANEPPNDQPGTLIAPFDDPTAKAAQKAWVKSLGVADEVMTNSVGMRLTLIPPGEFSMGNGETVEASVEFAHKYGETRAIPETFADEMRQHRVRITRAFYLGTYEVTVGQFHMFVEATGHKAIHQEDGWGYDGSDNRSPFKQGPTFTWQNWGVEQSGNLPVVNIEWSDAIAFCEWLSKRERVVYRLPTEAEWEYACRAGTTGRYNFGDDPEALAEFANVADATVKERWPWFRTIRAFDGHPLTAPVGSFRPNAFGLYDMHGNVWEWCADWHSSNYYENSPVDDPTGPKTGRLRMSRGGGWDSYPGFCRAAERGAWLPSRRLYDLGFRVVRSVER